MTRPLAAVVSFRLGAPDGVSVQARTWGVALQRLGFDIRRVAGELYDGPRPGDVVLPGLAVAAGEAVGPDGQARPGAAPLVAADVTAALDGADLVVVENVLSLPLHLRAAAVLTGVLADRMRSDRSQVLLHHHDLAWQRPETEHLRGLPPDLPGAVHVAINDFSRRELEERGFPAVVVRNAFDLDAPLGGRAETRAALAVGAEDLLVLQPTRATERKNIPAALRLCGQLATRFAPRRVVYWMPGPPEDGYAEILTRILAEAPVDVVRQAADMRDAYAAADLVVFPSTEGEGFGQPVIESVWARRPLAVAGYRALDEIVALGLRFLPVADPDAVAAALRRPDDGLFDSNLALARRHFSLQALEAALRRVLRPRGTPPAPRVA